MKRPYDLDVSSHAISSSVFAHVSKNTLVADASDLKPNWLIQLYNDAADEGIAIRSEKTGRIVRFYLDRTTTDVNRKYFFNVVEDDADGHPIEHVVIYNAPDYFTLPRAPV